MSVLAMAWAWQQPVKPTTKIVLLALADHADDSGKCWPGIAGIAKKCGLSERQVVRSTQLLSGLGHIKILSRGGNGEGRKSNVYFLRMQSDNLSHSGQSDNLSHSPGGKVTSATVQGDTVSPCIIKKETSIEPSDIPPIIPQEIDSLSDKGGFELPTWIDAWHWNAYVDMRSRIRKPMTDFAKILAVKQLDMLEKQGSCHKEVLAQSVMCSYPKFYPVNNETDSRSPRTATERRQRVGSYIDAQAEQAIKRGLD